MAELSLKSKPIAPPEPGLTPQALLARAAALVSELRARQAETEAAGRILPDVNARLVREGFYRIVQPRRFGGYEFDVPTFYRVMMTVSRGCPETGWVLALTAGHPLLLASFPEAGQVEAYGAEGEFRGPAAFNPPGTARKVDGGYEVSCASVSASGIDIGTHFVGMAMAKGEGPIQFILQKGQYAVVDDWSVMGMQGTGSKRVDARDVFVPEHRTVKVQAGFRGSQAIPAARLYDNPMYAGRIQPFLIGEAVAVAVGAARLALDLYEDALWNKRTMMGGPVPKQDDPEFQRHYGIALSLVSTAEAALVQAGEDFMAYAAEAAGGGEPFGEEREHRLVLIEQQALRMASEAVELIYRTAGTSASAKTGAAIGRVFRNLAVISTHPALQLDRFAVVAAKARFAARAEAENA